MGPALPWIVGISSIIGAGTSLYSVIKGSKQPKTPDAPTSPYSLAMPKLRPGQRVDLLSASAQGILSGGKADVASTSMLGN